MPRVDNIPELLDAARGVVKDYQSAVVLDDPVALKLLAAWVSFPAPALDVRLGETAPDPGPCLIEWLWRRSPMLSAAHGAALQAELAELAGVSVHAIGNRFEQLALNGLAMPDGTISRAGEVALTAYVSRYVPSRGKR